MKKTLTLIILTALMITPIVGCSEDKPGKSAKSDDSAVETVEGAVPFGEWGDVEQHADKEYHPCKVRISNLIKDNNDVQSHIDEYNKNVDSNHAIEPLTGKDKDLTEYIVIEYEVLFPDDFPTISYGNNGIYSPQIEFDAKTNDGSGFVASDDTYYVGLGMSTELTKLTDDELPLPGDTFKGAILLQMLKDYDSFHLDYMYKIGDTDDYIHALFAIKE